MKADLRSAELTRAVLHRARLREADLSGEDLTGAMLNAADLRGVNFTNCKGIKPDQFRDAIVDEKTVLPFGRLPSSN